MLFLSIMGSTDHLLAAGLFRPNRCDPRQGLQMSLWPEQISFLALGGAIISYSIELRFKCARHGLWWDSSALDTLSDQTKVRWNLPPIRFLRPKWPVIRPFRAKWPTRPSRPNWTLIRPKSDYGLDYSALELLSSSCDFGRGTHGCAFNWVWP